MSDLSLSDPFMAAFLYFLCVFPFHFKLSFIVIYSKLNELINYVIFKFRLIITTFPKIRQIQNLEYAHWLWYSSSIRAPRGFKAFQTRIRATMWQYSFVLQIQGERGRIKLSKHFSAAVCLTVAAVRAYHPQTSCPGLFCEGPRWKAKL